MNLLQQFLATRAAKGGKPVANSDAPVTRDEFNTVLRAVNALIEEVDLITSPDKLKAVMNEALTEAAKSAAPTVDARARAAFGRCALFRVGRTLKPSAVKPNGPTVDFDRN